MLIVVFDMQFGCQEAVTRDKWQFLKVSLEIFCILNNILEPLFYTCLGTCLIYTTNACSSILYRGYFEIHGWDRNCPAIAEWPIYECQVSSFASWTQWMNEPSLNRRHLQFYYKATRCRCYSSTLDARFQYPAGYWWKDKECLHI